MLRTRMKAAGVTPEKRGKRSFVSPEQLEILDEQDLRLKNGESLSSVSEEQETSIENVARSFDGLTELLTRYRALQEAVANQWVLSSAIVHFLIGAKPHGRSYQKLGFRFERTDRIGEWFVSKVHKQNFPIVELSEGRTQ